MTSRPATRRTVLAAAVAAAAATAASSARADDRTATRRPRSHDTQDGDLIEYRGWTTYQDWRSGERSGTRAVREPRAGVLLDRPAGTTEYTDPHTGRTGPWEYATWTSPGPPLGGPRQRGDRLLERRHPGGYLGPDRAAAATTPTAPPRPGTSWAAGPSGDGEDIRAHLRRRPGRRQEHASGPTPSPSTTSASALRLASYRLRLTLYRTPGSRLTPTVWRRRRDGLGHPRPLQGPGHRRPARRRGSNSPSRATRRTSTRASTRSTTTAARRGAAPPPRR